MRETRTHFHRRGAETQSPFYNSELGTRNCFCPARRPRSRRNFHHQATKTPSRTGGAASPPWYCGRDIALRCPLFVRPSGPSLPSIRIWNPKSQIWNCWARTRNRLKPELRTRNPELGIRHKKAQKAQNVSREDREAGEIFTTKPQRHQVGRAVVREYLAPAPHLQWSIDISAHIQAPKLIVVPNRNVNQLDTHALNLERSPRSTWSNSKPPHARTLHSDSGSIPASCGIVLPLGRFAWY